MYITKETKLQLSCRCHDNSYAAGLTQGLIRSQQSNGESSENVGAMSVPSKTPCPHSKRLLTGIFGFSPKETGAKGVAMATI